MSYSSFTVVKTLAIYLLVVAILGTSLQLSLFIKTVLKSSRNNSLVNSSNPIAQNKEQEIFINGGGGADRKYFTLEAFLKYSNILFEYTFPGTASHSSSKSSFLSSVSSAESKSGDIQLSQILTTLLPSLFLVKGTQQNNYSSCQLWYYIQVGSLLLCSLKITIVTVLDSWGLTSNTNLLISLIFGLGELWLVQNFMEEMRITRASNFKIKQYSQVFPVNDIELEECKTEKRSHKIYDVMLPKK